jgi:uncharacterized phage-associated protein
MFDMHSLPPGAQSGPYDACVAARDVAAALRERLPDLIPAKAHKLLYYCQGHHLAWFDRPLFAENIYAEDAGPVVDAPLDGGSGENLTEGELNTVSYVVGRYGRLTGRDLDRLTMGEDPWLSAQASGGHGIIRPESMRNYFLADGSPAAGEEESPLDPQVISRWLAGAQHHRSTHDTPDDLDAFRRRTDELRQLATQDVDAGRIR